MEKARCDLDVVEGDVTVKNKATALSTADEAKILSDAPLLLFRPSVNKHNRRKIPFCV